MFASIRLSSVVLHPCFLSPSVASDRTSGAREVPPDIDPKNKRTRKIVFFKLLEATAKVAAQVSSLEQHFTGPVVWLPYIKASQVSTLR